MFFLWNSIVFICVARKRWFEFWILNLFGYFSFFFFTVTRFLFLGVGHRFLSSFDTFHFFLSNVRMFDILFSSFSLFYYLFHFFILPFIFFLFHCFIFFHWFFHSELSKYFLHPCCFLRIIHFLHSSWFSNKHHVFLKNHCYFLLTFTNYNESSDPVVKVTWFWRSQNTHVYL